MSRSARALFGLTLLAMPMLAHSAGAMPPHQPAASPAAHAIRHDGDQRRTMLTPVNFEDRRNDLQSEQGS